MQFKFIYTNSALVSIRQAAVTKWKKSESLLVVSDSLWHRGLLPSKLLCPGKSPGKDAGVDCHFLLQVIFLTQASNPGLLHCRQILYHMSYQGSPRILGWVAYPFSRKTSWHELNRGLLHCRWILYQLATKEAHNKSYSLWILTNKLKWNC